MKISGSIIVRLEDADGDAEFTFKAPKLNEILQADLDAKKIDSEIERVKFHWSQIMKSLVKVTGLEHEDGKAVEVSEVKDLALPTKIMFAIVAAYNQAVAPKEKDKEKDFTQG